MSEWIFIYANIDKRMGKHSGKSPNATTTHKIEHIIEQIKL